MNHRPHRHATAHGTRRTISRTCRVVEVLILALGGVRAEASPLVRVPADTPSLQTAITQVDDGGVIEIAAGTYPAPAGAFRINDVGKGFTIRAAAGAHVVLDGGGTTDVLRFMNSTPTSSGPVVFQDLVFANGYGATEGLAAGVTLYRARATFVGCEFYRNDAVVSTTVGGGIYVAEQSTVHFIDTLWIENTSRTGGAGLGIRTDTDVFVHRGQFIRNRANPPNHVVGAGGGGINVGNARLWVTDTRFEANQAASFGGGLYGIGNWEDPVTTPRAEVTIANSTFVDNLCQPDPSVPTALPTEGGAVNVEDQTTLEIFNSRFLTNSAKIGGGVNVFRAIAEIHGSVFRGNRATDTAAGSGFGGAISANSGDGPTGPNRRPVTLTVEDSLLQGRYGAVTTTGQTAGCLFASGDGYRHDGDPGVPDVGTLEENRATVVLRRVAFYDCDAFAAAPRSGLGGAVAVPMTDLTVEDSLFVGSDALGNGGAGGALVVLFHSAADVVRTGFFDNTAATYGGAVFVQGSSLDLSDSQFAENEVSPGVEESEANSYGAAIFATPDDARNIVVSGLVAGNVFSRNVGMAIFDDDRGGGPINDVRYDDNDFFSLSFGGKVYRDSLTAAQLPSGLNSLVVNRNSGVPSTDKSSGGNSALGSAPDLGALLAVPSEILGRAPAGESAGPSASFLAAGWSGGTGELEGEVLTGSYALRSTTDPGTYTLFVDSEPFSDIVASAELPSVSLSASPPALSPGGSSDLLWSVDAGTLQQATLDQGIGLLAGTAGSRTVTPPATRTYHLLAVTREGGALDDATVYVSSGSGLPAPGITAPSPGQVVGVTSVTFSWGSVGGSQFYDLRVWRQADGSVVFSGSLAGAAATSTVIDVPAGSYVFGVRACSSAPSDTTCGSFGTVSFSVAPISPASAPTVISPADGTHFTTSTQTIQWTSVAGDPAIPDVFYDVLVTDVSSGATELQIRVKHPALSTIYSFHSSTDYEVRVRACQAGCGPWSAPVGFSVDLPPPPASAPTITQATVSGGNSLSAQWTSVANADFYEILVVQPAPAGPGGGALTVAARQTSQTQATLPVPTGSATVLVRGCNGDGCGPFSGGSGISPAGPNPSAPGVGTPTAGAIVDGPSVLFTWNRVAGDTGSGGVTYRLYVQDLSRSAPALDVYTTENFWAAQFRAEGARYDVVVLAHPGTAQQTQGPANGFHVRGTSPLAPTLVSPAHQSSLPAGNVQVGWTPLPGVELYEYYVSGTSGVAARGVTPGLSVRVPLTASGGPASYTAIMRACEPGARCEPGEEEGWGPWSNDGGGTGVTTFTVIP